MECNGFTEAEVGKLPQPNLKEINGIWLPPYITKERIDQIPKAPVRPDDIFVATFPKSAPNTTYDVLLNSPKLSPYFPCKQAPRGHKNLFGRFYTMADRMKEHSTNVSHVEFGSWYDHVLGWWSHRDDPNILFLKYEDMKKNLPSNVSKICKFLGKQLTSEEVKLISRQCTFEVMKSNSSSNKYYFDSVRKPNTCTFMRKGEVGDWKNYFTDEQNEIFDKQYVEKMKGNGLDFEWE